MPYRRAVSTLGCPALGLFEAFELAKRHGVDAIEVRALSGTLEIPEYLTRNHDTPAALAERLRGSAGRIVAFDTSFRLTGNSAADREKLLEFVPWAEALGVPWLRVFDGMATSVEAVTTIRWWQDLRRRHGWRVDCMVETHDSLFDAARIRQFLSEAPNTALLWDAHHTWKLGGEDPLATWQAIRLHVVHVHVKDSVSRASERHPYTYVLPGTGEFPMAPLADVLREQFNGAVCLEWELLWHPYLPPLEAALDAGTTARWW